MPAVVLGVRPTPVRLLGQGPTEVALRAVGAVLGDDGPTVVAEDGLDARSGADVRDRLGRGEAVLVLAQRPDAAPFYPVAGPIDEAPATGHRPALGSRAVGPGRLVFCQQRLARAAAAGDSVSCDLLSDLLAWVSEPRPLPSREALVKDDGRSLWRYSWDDETCR